MDLLKETKEMKHHLIQYNFHLRMDTVDISPFFPLQSNEDLNKFLQRDEEWIQRKKEIISSFSQGIYKCRNLDRYFIYFAGIQPATFQCCIYG